MEPDALPSDPPVVTTTETVPSDIGTTTTTVADLEVLAKLDQLNTSILDQNNLLIFLIGAICGIAFAHSLFKGWFRA
ncbi:hypothetical protein D3C71_1479100 [compost metagenome]